MWCTCQGWTEQNQEVLPAEASRAADVGVEFDKDHRPITAPVKAAPVVELVATPEKPKLPQPRILKVQISAARSLRVADKMVGTGRGASDPYARCEVVGKPSNKVQTSVVSSCLDPVWDFEGEISDAMEGDSLLFSVWDKDAFTSDPLGSVTIPYAGWADGFSGQVRLEDTKGAESYLSIAICTASGVFPTPPEPVTEFPVTIDGPPLGLDLDLLDMKFARVIRIIPEGKAAAYNKTAPADRLIKVGDFISCCNGGFGAALGDKITQAQKEGGKFQLSVRRSEEATVVVEPKGQSLGLDLFYEDSKGMLHEVIIRKVNPKGVAAASGKLFAGDRILSVSGVLAGIQASMVMDGLKKFKDLKEGEIQVVRAKRVPSSGPVDVSPLTRMATDDLGLLPQPEAPKFRTALVQIYVRSHPYGGSDKSANGHRYDSIPIANGIIRANMSCQLIHYVFEEHDVFLEVCKGFKALVVRCNPGQIKSDGGDQVKFDNAMRSLRKSGLQVWPSPDVMEFMGAKDALCKVAKLSIGLEDTCAYYTEKEFSAGFRKTMKYQPRVIKQNRGSAGEGIWIVKLKDGSYCGTYGEKSCADNEVLQLMEANDNHAEEHTVAEFVEFCVNGRTAKSGEWTSKGVGRYLEGGKQAGGQLVDQRFCPRIVEGELRYNMAGDSLVGIIHKKPAEGGISAVSGTGSIYTFYGPEEPLFRNLTESFLKRDLEKIMPCLGLSGEPIPLWWTTDFINASPVGTRSEDEKWIVGEFNCSCVGISKCLPAWCHEGAPTAKYWDVPAVDRAEAQQLGDLMGAKALSILTRA